MSDEDLEPIELAEPVERGGGNGNGERRRLFTATQIIVVFAIVSALWLGLDFSRRVASGERIGVELLGLEQDLAQEQARNAALKTQQAYVQSDAFVEDWARTEMKMVRPGEHLVVPVIATPVPAAPVPPGPPPVPPPAWRMWWDLLFGQ